MGKGSQGSKCVPPGKQPGNKTLRPLPSSVLVDQRVCLQANLLSKLGNLTATRFLDTVTYISNEKSSGIGLNRSRKLLDRANRSTSDGICKKCLRTKIAS